MRDNKVVYKIVAGCDGYNAKRLCSLIEKEGCVSVDDAYEKAVAAGVGCGDCLIVLGVDKAKYMRGKIPERYFTTFDLPDFNPRWEKGTADYTLTVNV
jgi:hypothetical protein